MALTFDQKLALAGLGMAALTFIAGLGMALGMDVRTKGEFIFVIELERLEREKPKPNLQFRRVYLSTVFVGHEMSGKSYNAWVLEIGNELSTSEIGPAKEIRAHVTYLDKNSALQTVCPARWGTYQPEESANIKQGESEGLILAFDKGHWYSDLFNGVDLPDKSKIEVRLIDRDGKDLLPEILSFEFRSWGLGESSLTKI